MRFRTSRCLPPSGCCSPQRRPPRSSASAPRRRTPTPTRWPRAPPRRSHRSARCRRFSRPTCLAARRPGSGSTSASAAWMRKATPAAATSALASTSRWATPAWAHGRVCRLHLRRRRSRRGRRVPERLMFGGQFVTPLVANPIGAAESGQSFVLRAQRVAGLRDRRRDRRQLRGRNTRGQHQRSLRRRWYTDRPRRQDQDRCASRRSSNRPFSGAIEHRGVDAVGTDEQSESGTGFAVGGGVSFGFASGFAFDIGFKKVMLDEAKALIGLGISYQR